MSNSTHPHPFEPTDDDIIDAMLTYGGSFIQRLARLYHSADLENRKKLRECWSSEWEAYRDAAKVAHNMKEIPRSGAVPC